MELVNRVEGASLVKETEIKTGYQVPFWWYDIRGFFIFKLCYQDRLLSLVNFFTKNLSRNHLEVAAGSGSFLVLCIILKLLKLRGPSAGIAFDYTEEMLVGAKKNLKKFKWWKAERADVTCMPYEDNRFETINVANAYHCFPDPRKATEEIYRVLKPNGTLALNMLTPPRGSDLRKKIAGRINRWGKKNKILEAPMSIEDTTNMFIDAGFSVESSSIRGNNFRLIVKKPNS